MGNPLSAMAKSPGANFQYLAVFLQQHCQMSIMDTHINAFSVCRFLQELFASMLLVRPLGTSWLISVASITSLAELNPSKHVGTFQSRGLAIFTPHNSISYHGFLKWTMRLDFTIYKLKLCWSLLIYYYTYNAQTNLDKFRKQETQQSLLMQTGIIVYCFFIPVILTLLQINLDIYWLSGHIHIFFYSEQHRNKRKVV